MLEYHIYMPQSAMPVVVQADFHEIAASGTLSLYRCSSRPIALFLERGWVAFVARALTIDDAPTHLAPA